MGQSDLNYARAEATVRSLVKSPANSMKTHIDVFARLKEGLTGSAHSLGVSKRMKVAGFDVNSNRFVVARV